MQEAAILGAISFFVGWVVLAFFSGILLDIVDATYLCYAIDKDTQTITKPDIHEIYSKASISSCPYPKQKRHSKFVKFTGEGGYFKRLCLFAP